MNSETPKRVEPGPPEGWTFHVGEISNGAGNATDATRLAARCPARDRIPTKFFATVGPLRAGYKGL